MPKKNWGGRERGWVHVNQVLKFKKGGGGLEGGGGLVGGGSGWMWIQVLV